MSWPRAFGPGSKGTLAPVSTRVTGAAATAALQAAEGPRALHSLGKVLSRPSESGLPRSSETVL